MFKKWLGLDKIEDILALEEEKKKKEGKNFEKTLNEFERLSGQNKKIKRDVSKIKKNTEELLQLKYELTKKDKLKVEFDSEGLENKIEERMTASEKKILEKIHARFSMVENALIDMTNRVAESRQKMESLKIKLARAREGLLKQGVYSAEINSAIEQTLSPLELEIFKVVGRAGEMDVKELAETVNVPKDKVIRTTTELKELGILEEVNLGRRIVFKTSHLLTHNR